MGKGLFREQALGRLSSPEQLDRQMRIAGPVGWTVVGTVIFSVLCVLLWGFFGTIPTHVQAVGILKLKGGGVRQVVARGEAQLSEIRVKAGQRVEAGQVLAILQNDELEQQVADAEQTVTTLRRDRERMVEFYAEFRQEEQRYFEEIRENTMALLEGSDEQIVANQKILEALERLLSEHYTTSVQVETARERLFETKATRDQSRQTLIQVEIQQLEQIRERTKDLENYDLQIVQAEGKLSSLEVELELASALRSPLDGRVAEVLAEKDAIVDEGTPIVLVEYGNPVLDAVLYAPAGQGKRIREGMVAHVAPDTVRRSEYGTLSARVIHVGRYPSTREEMLRVLNDENLVQSFLETGPPLLVEARLEPDPTTVSGYRWSSGKGPPVELTVGTLSTATVTVLEHRPIALVIPALRRFLGIYP